MLTDLSTPARDGRAHRAGGADDPDAASVPGRGRIGSAQHRNQAPRPRECPARPAHDVYTRYRTRATRTQHHETRTKRPTRARDRSASRTPPRAVRGGSGPRLRWRAAGRRPWPTEKSSSRDTSIAPCSRALHTSTRRCPRGGAPPGLLVSRRRWSLVFWGGLRHALGGEQARHVERPPSDPAPLPHANENVRTRSSQHGMVSKCCAGAYACHMAMGLGFDRHVRCVQQ